MNKQEEIDFVRQLTQATLSKKLRWSATATPDKFVASFKGKYAITIETTGADEEGNTYFTIQMSDDKRRTMLDFQTYSHELFDEARNVALNVDQAV